MAAGDITTAYGSQTALTITLDALAESGTRTVGQQSAAVTTSGAVDYLISGKIKTIASAEAGEIIEVWAYGEYESTPAYPGGFDGSNGARTPAQPQGVYLRLLASITLSAADAVQYYFWASQPCLKIWWRSSR
jgi:hypothetical protein